MVFSACGHVWLASRRFASSIPKRARFVWCWMIDESTLLGLTTAIVKSYVGAHRLRPAELPHLIHAIHGALDSLARPHPADACAPRKRSMTQVRASIRPRGLVSLQDRRTYQLLHRRLESEVV
jgi:predicted transcriptional regulator